MTPWMPVRYAAVARVAFRKSNRQSTAQNIVHDAIEQFSTFFGRRPGFARRTATGMVGRDDVACDRSRAANDGMRDYSVHAREFPPDVSASEPIVGTLTGVLSHRHLLAGRAVVGSLRFGALSLSETPKGWRTRANRVMLVSDDSTAQIAFWHSLWAVPVPRTA
jgi:hypothetical protein